MTANVNGKEGNAGKNGWRVLDREDRERAKEAGWRPQIVGRVANINTGAANGGGGRNAQNPGGGNTQNGGGGGGMLSPKSAGLGREYGGYESAESDLPRTPGWVPRLTPTRRGDELFLSVA